MVIRSGVWGCKGMCKGFWDKFWYKLEVKVKWKFWVWQPFVQIDDAHNVCSGSNVVFISYAQINVMMWTKIYMWLFQQIATGPNKWIAYMSLMDIVVNSQCMLIVDCYLSTEDSIHEPYGHMLLIHNVYMLIVGCYLLKIAYMSLMDMLLIHNVCSL